jgi:hypothetical protein
VARWRTSAALATVALVATACGQGTGTPEAVRDVTTTRPTLAPTGQTPLTVTGMNFRPHEHVRLAAKGLESANAVATADESGSFTVRFHGLKACDSVTVTAVGSKGSRTEFNLSQIVCTDA